MRTLSLNPFDRQAVGQETGCCPLPYKPAEEGLLPRVAVHFRDGLGQGNALGTSVDAVLRVGTFRNAARTHESRKALALIHRSRGVHIEKAHLADDGRAHELIMLVHLRTNLEAVPARDAIRKRIAPFLNFGRYARAFAKTVSAIDGNPGLHALQAFKHELAIHGEIAHQRKLGHRLDSNRLFELVDKRRTRHARLAINQHRAGPADLFEAIRIVGNGRGLLTVARDGILSDVPQANDDVHGRPPLERKFFPARRFRRSRLPFYSNDDLFCFWHRPSTTTGFKTEGPSPCFYFAASDSQACGLIQETSTGSYVSWISLFTHFARVVFSQLASSRSGKSGL